MPAPRDHGPLPALLLGLTVVSGLVDAFSYLTLGHVFVANMTGNVVFLGFALAGVGGISIVASLLAMASFIAGAVLGGRLAARHTPHRGNLLAVTAVLQAALVLAAATVAQIAGVGSASVQVTLVCMLAFATGGQNEVVRRLAVPDLTTTVLTMTITGLAADSTPGQVRLRRAAAVLSMMFGAFVGAVLVQATTAPASLWLTAAVLATCAAVAYTAARSAGSATWR